MYVCVYIHANKSIHIYIHLSSSQHFLCPFIIYAHAGLSHNICLNSMMHAAVSSSLGCCRHFAAHRATRHVKCTQQQPPTGHALSAWRRDTHLKGQRASCMLWAQSFLSSAKAKATFFERNSILGRFKFFCGEKKPVLGHFVGGRRM